MLLLVIYLILVSYLIKRAARETFGQEEEQLDAAVIVEPRKHEYLFPIVKDNLKKLKANEDKMRDKNILEKFEVEYWLK